MHLKAKQPRIAPLEPPFDTATAAALERLGPPIQLFRVFARRPALAEGIAGWGRYYMSKRSALTLRQRELVIDRTTAVCRADYEWAVHIHHFADQVGLSVDQQDSLVHGHPHDPCWEPDEAAILAAVDELHESADLGDTAWERLAAVLDSDAVLEVVLLTGWYHAISFAANALRLPLEPATTGLDES